MPRPLAITEATFLTVASQGHPLEDTAASQFLQNTSSQQTTKSGKPYTAMIVAQLAQFPVSYCPALKQEPITKDKISNLNKATKI